MLYRALKQTTINLEPKQSADLDAQNGVVLVPNAGAKVFVHWLTESGKLRQTFTMNFATHIQGKVKLINALEKSAQIQVIHLD